MRGTRLTGAARPATFLCGLAVALAACVGDGYHGNLFISVVNLSDETVTVRSHSVDGAHPDGSQAYRHCENGGPGLLPGPWRITASDPTASFTTDVVAPSGGATMNLNLVIAPDGSISEVSDAQIDAAAATCQPPTLPPGA